MTPKGAQRVGFPRLSMGSERWQLSHLPGPGEGSREKRSVLGCERLDGAGAAALQYPNTLLCEEGNLEQLHRLLLLF